MFGLVFAVSVFRSACRRRFVLFGRCSYIAGSRLPSVERALWWCSGCDTSWSSSRSESLETTVGGFFPGFLAGGFGSVLRFGEGCCSSSDSDSVLCSAFWAALFLAVGGPTRGVLPLFLRCWSTSSSPSSKVVGRCLAAVRHSYVRDLLSAYGRAYNCVGCSSPGSFLSGLNGRAFLVSCLGVFVLGSFQKVLAACLNRVD